MAITKLRLKIIEKFARQFFELLMSFHYLVIIIIIIAIIIVVIELTKSKPTED